MRSFLQKMFVVGLLILVPCCSSQKEAKVQDKVFQVVATMQTQPVATAADKADDPCIYIHPENREKSLIIGTDKDKQKGGIRVYNIDGKEIQFLQDGAMNNVDIRHGFSLGSKDVALVVAGNRTKNTFAIYKVDPDSGKLENVAAKDLPLGLKAYGSCMYASKKTGKLYVFVNSKNGNVEQWHLFDDGKGKVDGKMVRKLEVSSQTEGCVADDILGNFYLGEEVVGIWRFGAEPESQDIGKLIDRIGDHLVADVEGLTIYYADQNSGYLIASSQGNNTYVVYEREGQNKYLGRFKIIDGSEIDGTSDTDGIDVTNLPFGKNFEQGMFVAQDGTNKGGNQNFKCVSWESIAKSFDPQLKINPEFKIS